MTTTMKRYVWWFGVAGTATLLLAFPREGPESSAAPWRGVPSSAQVRPVAVRTQAVHRLVMHAPPRTHLPRSGAGVVRVDELIGDDLVRSRGIASVQPSISSPSQVPRSRSYADGGTDSALGMAGLDDDTWVSDPLSVRGSSWGWLADDVFESERSAARSAEAMRDRAFGGWQGTGFGGGDDFGRGAAGVGVGDRSGEDVFGAFERNSRVESSARGRTGPGAGAGGWAFPRR